MKKIALITGATSGIGEATARELAGDFRLIIHGRRQDRLADLASELGEVTEVKTLSFDVRNRDDVFAGFESLPEEWRSVDVLVNNAGNAHGLAPIHKGDMNDWDAMIDINVKGLLYVSKAVVPGMVKRRSGHIVNIGSIAGREIYPGGNVYCASKFAVDAINNGMRLDLNAYGIKVSQVNPGLVETEFSEVRFKGDKERAAKVYEGFEPLKGKDVAEMIHYIVTRPPHVMVSDVVLFSTAQASSTMVNRGN